MADDFTTWCPSIPASHNAEWRLNTAQFGDGYQQRQLDGINALNESWSVEYATREVEVMNQMVAYLTTKGAFPLPFKDPATGLVHQVFCDGWDIDWGLVRWDDAGKRTIYGSLSVEFRKANGVGLT